MKFYKYYLIAFCVLLNIGCRKKHPSNSEITMDYPIVSFFSMDVALDTLKLDSFIVRESIDFPTNMDGELAKNNTSKSLIKSAQLVSLKLQILDYAYADSTKYDNLRDIKEIYLDIKKDGVGQTLVAQKVFNPDVRANILNMDMVGTELKSYLQQETFRMVFKFKKRRQMHNEMPFTIVGKFKIIADPLD